MSQTPSASASRNKDAPAYPDMLKETVNEGAIGMVENLAEGQPSPGKSIWSRNVTDFGIGIIWSFVGVLNTVIFFLNSSRGDDSSMAWLWLVTAVINFIVSGLYIRSGLKSRQRSNFYDTDMEGQN